MTKKEFSPDDLEGIPELGPIGQETLLEHGILTKRDFIVAGAGDIAEFLKLSPQEAGKMISFVRNEMAKLDLVEKSVMNANELLAIRKKLERISTGAKAVDDLLTGGVETEAVTEFFGAAKSGKTQLSLTMACIAQQPKEKGGLDGMVMYVDTENTCRPERIIEIAIARGFVTKEPGKKQDEELKKLLDNIIILRPRESAQQLLMVDETIPQLLTEFAKNPKAPKVRLIIVDSGTALFRVMGGMAFLARKQQQQGKMIHRLHIIAETYKLAVIFINQVYSTVGMFTEQKASGGNTVAHATTYRIKLGKSKGDTYIAKFDDSPMHDKDDALFMLTLAGFSDIPAKKKKSEEPEE